MGPVSTKGGRLGFPHHLCAYGYTEPDTTLLVAGPLVPILSSPNALFRLAPKGSLYVAGR